MLKRMVVSAVFLCIVALFVPSAHAILIIDTGSAPHLFPGLSLYGGDNYPDSFQWLAGKITLGEGHTVNDIQGWIYSYPGIISIAVYGDGGTIPNTGTVLYEGGFSVPSIQSNADWYGVSGLNLDLGTGSYWVAFEIRSTDTYGGHMPAVQYPGINQLPNPLSNYASANEVIPNWHEAGQYSVFGLRVNADETQSTVPEPCMIVLFGIGSAAMALLRRKNKLS